MQVNADPNSKYFYPKIDSSGSALYSGVLRSGYEPNYSAPTNFEPAYGYSEPVYVNAGGYSVPAAPPKAARVILTEESDWKTKVSSSGDTWAIHRQLGVTRLRQSPYQPANGTHSLTDVKRGASQANTDPIEKREAGFSNLDMICHTQVTVQDNETQTTSEYQIRKYFWGSTNPAFTVNRPDSLPKKVFYERKRIPVSRDESFWKSALAEWQLFFERTLRSIPAEVGGEIRSVGETTCEYYGSNIRHESIMLASTKIPFESELNAEDKPQASRTVRSVLPRAEKAVKNFRSYPEAHRKMMESGKPLLVLVFTENCHSCDQLVSQLKSSAMRELRSKLEIAQVELFSDEAVETGRVTETTRLEQLESLASLLRLEVADEELSETFKDVGVPILIGLSDADGKIWKTSGAQEYLSESDRLPDNAEQFGAWIRSFIPAEKPPTEKAEN